MFSSGVGDHAANCGAASSAARPPPEGNGASVSPLIGDAEELSRFAEDPISDWQADIAPATSGAFPLTCAARRQAAARQGATANNKLGTNDGPSAVLRSAIVMCVGDSRVCISSRWSEAESKRSCATGVCPMATSQRFGWRTQAGFIIYRVVGEKRKTVGSRKAHGGGWHGGRAGGGDETVIATATAASSEVEEANVAAIALSGPWISRKRSPSRYMRRDGQTACDVRLRTPLGARQESSGSTAAHRLRRLRREGMQGRSSGASSPGRRIDDHSERGAIGGPVSIRISRSPTVYRTVRILEDAASSSGMTPPTALAHETLPEATTTI